MTHLDAVQADPGSDEPSHVGAAQEPHAVVAPDLTLGVTWPDLAAFRALAPDRRVIPVVRRFLADGETPIGVYRKLARDAPGTFLLESAEQGLWSRWSIVGARSHATLTGCRRRGALARRAAGRRPDRRRPAARPARHRRRPADPAAARACRR